MASSRRLLTNHQGLSLIEIIAASVVGALLAGGTMTAFVMGLKTSQQSLSTAQATQLAQQTLERFRDKIACQNGRWYNDSCAPTLPSGAVDDDLPPGSALATFDGSRKYTVTKEDCDGDGTVGDCLQVVSRVTWTPPQ